MSDTQQVTYVTTPPTGPDAPARTPEQQAADTAAIARTQSHQPAPHEPGRPDWLPPQFNSVADFVKSSDETRAKLTRTEQELAATKRGAPPKEPPAAPEPDTRTTQPEQNLSPDEQQKAAQSVVAKAGLDVSPWQSEFDTSGDVSEKGRAQIAKALEAQFGEQSRTVVDNFIEGQKARRSNYEGAVHQMAGGKSEYEEMMTWAKTSLTDAEKASYNKSVNTMDLTSAQMAIDGLKARFGRERGSNPQLLTGDNVIANSNAGFASTFDMTKAMGDPRYGKDPVYTKSVEQKAMRSNF